MYAVVCSFNVVVPYISYLYITTTDEDTRQINPQSLVTPLNDKLVVKHITTFHSEQTYTQLRGHPHLLDTLLTINVDILPLGQVCSHH